jgi:alginate O-acetyltransferase complex protein AlgI
MSLTTAQGIDLRAQRKSAQEDCAAINPARFAPLGAQLALLLIVFHGFNVEGEAFMRLATACFAGFAVHYFLPFHLKKQGMIAISILGAMYALLQTDTRMPFLFQLPLPVVTVSATLVLAVLFYYSLHLRLPFAVRMLPVLGMAGVLAWARNNNVGGMPNVFWAVVGSVFMFRLIIYAYDVRMSRKPETLTDYLCYILLLPNFYFTLFPVVDYSTFKRTWYARDIHVIAQEGIFWIVRGTIQLMLYRIIYHRVIIGPHEVQDFWTLLQWVFPTYLLYLKISGHFHIIVGMLKLFGYDLPETHRLYLLASSFTDFWRRINIYWKDFMIKCFFYPVHFRLRRKNESLALIAGTITVFVATTVLHGYQWFWLRGHFHITGPDVLFWSILGVAVIINVLIESRRKPKLNARPRPKALTYSVHALKVVAMYITISVLWSMWSTQSITDWIETVTYWR